MAGLEIPSKRQKDDKDLWKKLVPNFNNLQQTTFEQFFETDVTIDVKCASDHKEIRSHKFILSANSPILQTMVSDRWIKKPQIVTCNDDNPDYFHHFVKMMYWDGESNKFDKYDIPHGMTPEIAVGVLSLADKYLAYDIFRRAEHLIISYLTKRSENVTVKLFTLLKCLPICQVGQMARPIYRTVLNCLLEDGEAIFTSDAVLKLNEADLADIVGDNYLRIPERTIYNGCYRWGQEQCKLKDLPTTGENVRSVLKNKNIIKAIRFPLLDELVIRQEVLPTNILTPREMVDLLFYIRNKRRAGWKPHSKFPLEENPFKHLVDFSTTHGFTMTLSKEMTLSTLVFFAGSVKKYRVIVEFKFFGGHYDSITESKKLNGKWLCIPTLVPIPANTPVHIEFTITGGDTYETADRVMEATKEITYWENEPFFITFKASPNCANGMKQIPILRFSSPKKVSR